MNNWDVVKFINNDLNKYFNKDQLSGVIVVIMLLGLPKVIMEPRLSLINLFIISTVIIYLIVFIILRHNVNKYMKMYFLYMGTSSVIISIIASYDAYRMFMLYKEDSFLYLIFLIMVALCGYLFHFIIFKRKINNSNDKRKTIKDYTPLYMTAGVSGMMFAKMFLSGMSQKSMYGFMGMLLTLMLFIVLSNIKYLIMFQILTKQQISFEKIRLNCLIKK